MDPISNMIVAIKNASAVGKEIVEVPGSKMKLAIAKILKQEGFIEDFKLTKTSRLSIRLKYKGKTSSIMGIERISKPGRRIYAKCKEIPNVLGGLGIVIISTPHGVMTGKEAKKKNLGGELICKVW